MALLIAKRGGGAGESAERQPSFRPPTPAFAPKPREC
jgi:hypothetical protein